MASAPDRPRAQTRSNADDDGRIAVVAHSLLGDAAAIRSAIELAMADDVPKAPHTLLSLALERIDEMTQRCRDLAAGLIDPVTRPHDVANPTTIRRFPTGTSVELHSTFRDTWSGGFEILASVAGGYRVRRCSDGSVLPGSTSASDLRVAGLRPRQ